MVLGADYYPLFNILGCCLAKLVACETLFIKLNGVYNYTVFGLDSLCVGQGGVALFWEKISRE